MTMSIRVPDSQAGRISLEIARRYYTPSLLNHCLRSYFLAARKGQQHGIAFDDELLYVAALLHDIGLTQRFDSYTLPFEEAGADVAWVFAAAVGWSPERRERVGEVIVRHMGDEVDPDEDPEGHLLEAATALDIGGRNPELWPRDFLATLNSDYPRLGLASEFADLFDDQADRKPDSAAARASRSGIRQRLETNPLVRRD